ncbi:MAG: type II secretion system protein GspG [Planctomycetota bacterium]|nr:type II secretion system protein GspG [Planctomycetota bacterium]
MNRFRQHRTRITRRGFTLVEVIVMVTIVAILGAVVATTMIQQGAEGKAQAAKIGANRIRSAINQYLLDKGYSRPGNDFDPEVLTLREEDGGGRNGPYLNSTDHLYDPWENLYVVVVPGEKNFDFDVVSYGELGQVGGTGPESDIHQ